MQGRAVLVPVRNALDTFLAVLPRILGFGVILIVGWIVVMLSCLLVWLLVRWRMLF